jgi:type II secretory pathway pseudopilin PulG
MTLIETLVAITMLTVAIIAPMSLTMQSLSGSYYARDQVVAFNLAQEALESVRAIRDGNVLQIAYGTGDCDGSPMHLMCGIPTATDFMIDTRKIGTDAIILCDADGTVECDPLETDGELYGYDTGWEPTVFTRTVHADFIPGTQDEIQISVKMEWRVGPVQLREFTIYENLYRWVNDGSV